MKATYSWAASSVQRTKWSKYNQKEYHDLYKSFYDFYLPIVNDEQSLATVTYAIVAVNAPDDRDIMNSGTTAFYPQWATSISGTLRNCKQQSENAEQRRSWGR